MKKTWDEVLEEIYKGENIDVECKRAENEIPRSVYQSYSSFANTKGGMIVLGVEEDKSKTDPRERFIIRGVKDYQKQSDDFWSAINGNKANANILVDDNVYEVENNGIALLVIDVPKADYTMRPIYIGENPYMGTYKRNHEGDYRAKEYEVRAMIRDQSTEGNDRTILEGFTMDDIDADTMKRYRIMFNTWNPDHVWSELPDKEFLEMLGGYRRDRREQIEGLTVAGLMMFGKGLVIRDKFSNIFMDYRNEAGTDGETRWIDRVTYDGTWENNLFNFFRKVMPKLTEDLKKPFVLENQQRVEDTPMHKAIREAFVNMIIHADYRMDAGVLKIIKSDDGLKFTNPGNLKLPKEQIYRGGDSKARNPHMQTMLRMIGFGDNAGSGFPDILKIWEDYGLDEPELFEDTVMNQVTLTLKFVNKNEGLSLESERSSSKKQKNERSLSEVLSEVLKDSEYKKLEDIIKYIEKNGSVTPKEAGRITGKSVATVRRYLKILVETGYIQAEGNTNNSVYVIFTR